MTRPTVEVLRLLLAAPADEPLWAARIGDQAALGKSTVSQILATLAERRWLVLRREQGAHPGRPARVLCALTRQGRREAEAALAALHVRNQRGSGEPMAIEDPMTHQGPERNGRRGRGLHHLVRLPDIETLRRDAAAADPGGDTAVPEAVAVKRMAALREALGALQTLNGILTREFLARRAVGPAHRQEHWDIMNDILEAAREIRSKALRAHNY